MGFLWLVQPGMTIIFSWGDGFKTEIVAQNRELPNQILVVCFLFVFEALTGSWWRGSRKKNYFLKALPLILMKS